jgi:opacity protein-like surface antigen
MRYPVPLLLCAFVLAFAAAPAAAQPDAVGGTEASGIFGGVFGVGAHPAVGAAAAYPTSRHIVPNVEFTYSPLDSPPGVSSRLWDVNGGIHVRFPGHVPRLAPYLGVGLGLVRFSHRIPSPPFGSVTASENHFAANLSGGARYYITDNFGVRPEIKGFIGDKSFARLSVGVFWQF